MTTIFSLVQLSAEWQWALRAGVLWGRALGEAWILFLTKKAM